VIRRAFAVKWTSEIDFESVERLGANAKFAGKATNDYVLLNILFRQPRPKDHAAISEARPIPVASISTRSRGWKVPYERAVWIFRGVGYTVDADLSPEQSAALVRSKHDQRQRQIERASVDAS